MKLVIAIVSTQDVKKLQKELTRNSFQVTTLATSGGFLRQKNTTLLIGVEDNKIPDILDLIEANSKKRETTVPSTIINEFGSFSTLPTAVMVGGAVIFVLKVEQFLKI